LWNNHSSYNITTLAEVSSFEFLDTKISQEQAIIDPVDTPTWNG